MTERIAIRAEYHLARNKYMSSIMSRVKDIRNRRELPTLRTLPSWFIERGKIISKG
jgi:hypothetical protein